MKNITIFLLVVIIGVWLVHRICRERRIRTFFNRAKLGDFSAKENDVTVHSLVVGIGGVAVEPDFILPAYFKWKESVLVPVRDQGKCASCWAFAVADCLADRLSVETGGKVKTCLSTQELVSCVNRHLFHCGRGGIPELAYSYVIAQGLSTESAYPYQQQNTRSIQECEASSSVLNYVWVDSNRAEYDKEKVFGRSGTAKNLCYDVSVLPFSSDAYNQKLQENIVNMKTEIYLHGPIVGTMYVHKDLYDYDGKHVYEAASTSPLMGGHAIEIFGWCSEGENTQEGGFQNAYWICRNSWGLKWPHNLPYGLMYIRMGTNESGVESRASSVQPLLNSYTSSLASGVSRQNLSYSKYTDYVQDPQRINFIRTDTSKEQFT